MATGWLLVIMTRSIWYPSANMSRGKRFCFLWTNWFKLLETSLPANKLQCWKCLQREWVCLFVTKPSFPNSVATWPMVVPICWSTLPTMPGLVVAAPLTNTFPWRYCVQLRIEYPLPAAPTPESVLSSILEAVSFRRPACTRTRPWCLLSS